MNGNVNNIVSLVNTISAKYGLSREQSNELATKYQNDTRNIENIKREIENTANYYMHQNKLAITIQNTPSLNPGKNYYLTAFDSNSNVYLQPVSVTVTNPESSEVLVENTFKGYQKHTQVDDLEIAICQIGKLLNRL